MDMDMDEVVKAFGTELRQRLGSRVKQIILFGSRARREAHEGSDYDLLVVVDARTPELRRIVLDVETGLLDRYGALVTSILRSEAEWEQSHALPLGRNILRDGVAV